MTVVEWVCVVAGSAVVAVSALLAAAVREVYDRLHLLGVSTSLGAPLLGLGLAIGQGWSLATGMILATTAIIVVTGPVLSAATGRMTAARGEHAGRPWEAEEPPR